QDMIDIAAHGARAARTPGPYRRRLVIDYRDRRHLPAHPLRNPMREFGTVDDDEEIGLCRNDRRGHVAYITVYCGQLRNHAQPNEGDLLDRNERLHPLMEHLGSAGAAEE